MDKSIVVLTGAGVSQESGVRTFRDQNGLWENHSVEDVASPEGFSRDPELVHRFYNQRRAQLKTVEPNPAHLALARLEREWKGDFLLITQNVDDLHLRAGSKNVLSMHGELTKARCEIFLCIGTSGLVYPAAGFVELTPQNARRIECNREATGISKAFTERRIGAAGDKVPELVRELLEDK